MAVYEVQAPDGSILEIEGPDNADEKTLQAFAAQQFGAQQPAKPGLTGKTRSAARVAKNVGVGAVGGALDITPVGLGVMAGQAAARLPGWSQQAGGWLGTQANKLIDSPYLAEMSKRASQEGEAKNAQIAAATERTFGTPWVSATGLLDKAATAMLPELQAQNKDEAAIDAMFQVMASGGRGSLTDIRNIIKNKGALSGAGDIAKALLPLEGTLGNIAKTTAAGAGTYMGVQTDNPLWAIGGVTLPAAGERMVKKAGDILIKPSQTIARQIQGLGIKPNLTNEQIGKQLLDIDAQKANQAFAEQQALKGGLESRFQQIAEPLGGVSPEGVGKTVQDKIKYLKESRYAPWKENILSSVESKVPYVPVSPSIVDEVRGALETLPDNTGVLRSFDKDIQSMLIPDVSTGSLKITPRNLDLLKNKYGRQVNRLGTPEASAVYGKIKDLENQAAQAAGEGESLAKFNQEYRDLSNLERGYVSDKLPSEVSTGLYKLAEKNPETFSKAIEPLPPGAREVIATGNVKQLAGGVQPSADALAKNINNLDDASLLSLVGGDAQKAKELRDFAGFHAETAQKLPAKELKSYEPIKTGSEEFTNWHRLWKKDPEAYVQATKDLPQNIKDDLISGHLQEIGGGKDFDFTKWGKNVSALDDEARLALAGGDPAKAEQITKIADKAKNLESFRRTIERGLGLAAYKAGGGLTSLKLTQILSSKDASTVMNEVLTMPAGKYNAPRKMEMWKRINTILSREGRESGYDAIEEQQKEPAASPALTPIPVPPPGDDIPDDEKEVTQKGGSGNDTLSNDKIIQGMIKSESGGNPNAKNPKSSASGILQYVDKTWNTVVKKYPELGLSREDKNDPNAQKLVTNTLIEKEYKPALKRAGVATTPGSIYALHHFGPEEGIRILKAKNSPVAATRLVSKDVIKANPSVFYDESGKPRSGRRLYAWLNERVTR